MTLSWQPLARVLFEGDAHVMEDACGFRGPHAWVIDGATELLEPIGLPAASDPQWLAQQLSVELARAAHPVRHDGGARELLARALAEIDSHAQKLVGKERQRFPSAAISVATLNDDGVEVASLADCTVVVRTGDGAIHLVRAGDADAAVEAAMAAGRGAPAAVQAPVDAAERRRLLVADREQRNMPGKLWVARREPEAAEHAHVVQLGRPELMVMATDGAWRAVDLGVVSGPEEFLDRTKTTLKALALMHELRARQAEIGEVADDAAVLTLAPVPV